MMKQITGYPDYFITDFGEVFSCRPFYPRREPRPLTLLNHAVESGYHYVILCGDNSRRRAGVHQLVAEHFIRKPTGFAKLVVRHLDNNPANNVSSNLAWGTPQENLADRLGHGTMTHGEANGQAIVDVATVLKIRQKRINGEKCQDIAAEFGISPQEVHRIGNGQRWSHIPGPVAPRQRKLKEARYARAIA